MHRVAIIDYQGSPLLVSFVWVHPQNVTNWVTDGMSGPSGGREGGGGGGGRMRIGDIRLKESQETVGHGRVGGKKRSNLKDAMEERTLK